MAKPRVAPPPSPAPPDGFEVRRDLKPGHYPILQVFPGLDRLPTARRQVRRKAERERLHGSTFIELVDDDVWMYVAPWKMPRIPKRYRRRWNPVSTPNVDTIVVGLTHLKESPALTLYLDIFHELCHILQRKDGRELFPDGIRYVDRSTEIDAYRFVVDEARRFDVPDEVLREYLVVEWIDRAEFLELLDAVHVARPP